MIMVKISGVMLTLIIIYTSVQSAENQWESVKNENNIEIYTRHVPGSAIKEFRAVTVMQSSLSSILALLEDTSAYTRWMHRCSESAILTKKNDSERIVYSVTSSPWPVKSRDIAVKSSVARNKKTGVVTVSMTGLPGYIPAKPGRVRMERLNGVWILEPKENGTVRVTYRIHSEPGGSIPDSLVNSSLVDIPYNTLYKMRSMVLQSPYKEAKYRDIVEK